MGSREQEQSTLFFLQFLLTFGAAVPRSSMLNIKKSHQLNIKKITPKKMAA